MTIASLTTGMTATSQSLVNCAEAVRIGNDIQQVLDDESPVKSIKKSAKCKNLASLQEDIH